ncbi:MAG: ferritin-like domain-containing protein, partial [Myxococcaceae bacterium]
SLRRFLGDIDTSQEAALLAFAHGYSLSCDDLERGGVRANPLGGYDVIGTRGFACGVGTEVTQFILRVTASGEVEEASRQTIERGSPNCYVGRRPAGLHQRPAMGRTGAPGRHFAEVAQLEAAAVDAFLRLRAELRVHGAPRTLQQSALVSAVEEVSHAQVTRQLAEAHGARPVAPHIAKLPLRPLFEVALDNRVEGCVRETWGALVAHHQAVHARDPRTKQVMARIAVEETHHAALSWAVDRWACSKLDRADRAALGEAQVRAAVELRDEAAGRVDADLVDKVGLPEPEKAVALVEQLTRELAA